MKFKKGQIPWNKGKTNCISEEVRNKISQKLKGHKLSEETKLKMSIVRKGQKHKPSKRKPLSEETKKKISLSMKGRVISESARIQISNSLQGKRCSSRTKFKKGSIPWNKGKEFMKGEKHPLFGKHHTEETLAKISLANRGKIAWNKGLKQHGLCGNRNGENNPNWNGGKEARLLRFRCRRRNLGYNTLNRRFNNSEAHHIDMNNVLNIPKELHRLIRHKLENEDSMLHINMLAFMWWESSVI